MNQALQYDNGKYYYIEYYIEGEATRIELAPESIEIAEDLLVKRYRFPVYSNGGELSPQITEGIYPVQVKVEMVDYNCRMQGKECISTTKCFWRSCKRYKQYAILSEVEDETNEVGRKCQGCGRRYKVDFLIPDELWAKITPKAGAAGLLCGSCIAKMKRQKRAVMSADQKWWR